MNQHKRDPPMIDTYETTNTKSYDQVNEHKQEQHTIDKHERERFADCEGKTCVVAKAAYGQQSSCSSLTDRQVPSPYPPVEAGPQPVHPPIEAGPLAGWVGTYGFCGAARGSTLEQNTEATEHGSTALEPSTEAKGSTLEPNTEATEQDSNEVKAVATVGTSPSVGFPIAGSSGRRSLNEVRSTMPGASGLDILEAYLDEYDGEDDVQKAIVWGLATLRAMGYEFDE
jgi:hypothetical protein